MDSYSFCGYNCSIVNTKIGKFCSIASGVVIGGIAHPVHFVSTSPVFLSHKDSVRTKFSHHEYLPEIHTNIGHDVWIGEGAFIKAGVKIGNGAVIGMGSVVTKDVPDYAIVAGNPAKIIRYRFEQEIIDALIASEWWSLPAYKLKKLGSYTNDPKVFIEKLKGG
ncbi:UNVERIFIED_CONTAM: cat [Trichonephila clavipes]